MVMVALNAAIVAGLVAVHDTINELWWLPAAGAVIAGALMVASVWPRTLDLGADLVDLHDKMREKPRLNAARSMFNAVSQSADRADAILSGKTFLFRLGLVALALSLLGSLPVVLFRP